METVAHIDYDEAMNDLKGTSEIFMERLEGSSSGT